MMESRATIHPQKFALWLAMGSIIMMFGGFTSAYIVKQAAGNWLEFPLPKYFYLSAVVGILCSVMLHFSIASYKNGNESRYKGLLVGALVCAIVFVVSQALGCTALFENGVDLKANVSGSFLYLITWVHLAHILGGVAAITLALIHAFTLEFEYKQYRRNRFELVVQYWHFVDLLWIVIMIFLLTTK